MAQSDDKPTLTSITSESFPHLKRGVMRDFLDILNTHGYYREANYNRTDHIYTFESGSQIEFFSSDQADKLRGPRRDRLFINEANNVRLGVFDQLEPRTKGEVFMDWNPTHEFWAHELKRDDMEFIRLTYKDNEALDEAYVRSIEARKNNKNWWRVYGLGLIGIKEGLIYDNWDLIDSVPEDARLEMRGLDFGYSNHPSALVDIYKYNDQIILDEQLYRVGMKNPQLAEFINELDEQVLVVADSAEPKSIDEIADYGVDIIGAKKGADSVGWGIQVVQDQKLLVTKRSTNLIKELRNYMWKIDKDGKALNAPEKGFDHGADAFRYAITELLDTRILDDSDFDVL